VNLWFRESEYTTKPSASLVEQIRATEAEAKKNKLAIFII
jgi:hypothetical protein